MAYGYIDAALGTHDHHTQHFSILSHAAAYGQGPVHICHEVAPEDADGNKSILFGMLSTLQREDVLILTDFTKLGNSTVEVLEVLSTLSRTGVKLYVVNSEYRLDSNSDALVVATACSLVAQIEKELDVRPEPAPAPIQMQLDDADLHTPARRTRKSKLDGKEDEIKSMLADGRSQSEIARVLNVTTRQSLSDFILSRNLFVQNPSPTT